MAAPARPRRIGRGLRGRVTLGFTLLGFTAVFLHALALYWQTERQEEELINQFIADDLDRRVELLASAPAAALQGGRNTRAWAVRTPAERARLPWGLAAAPYGFSEIMVGGREHHVGRRRLAGLDLYVTHEAERYETRMHRFEQFLAGSLLVAALALYLAGRRLARGLTHSVEDLTRRVGALQGGDDGELAGRYPERELAALAQAFDDYQQRVGELLAREREFTANLSHELRNPLTAVQSGAELLAAEPGLSDKGRERLAGITRAAARMTGLTRALLLLAREEHDGDLEEVNLAGCLTEAAEPLCAGLAARGVALCLEDVPADATLLANRHALYLVLANLLGNAAAHTERGAICLRYRAPRLILQDSGHGIPADELPHVFERAFRGRDAHAGGAGLGLALVRHLCQRYGWKIALDSTPGVGTTILLDLTPARPGAVGASPPA